MGAWCPAQQHSQNQDSTGRQVAPSTRAHRRLATEQQSARHTWRPAPGRIGRLRQQQHFSNWQTQHQGTWRPAQGRIGRIGAQQPEHSNNMAPSSREPRAPKTATKTTATHSDTRRPAPGRMGAQQQDSTMASNSGAQQQGSKGASNNTAKSSNIGQAPGAQQQGSKAPSNSAAAQTSCLAPSNKAPRAPTAQTQAYTKLSSFSHPNHLGKTSNTLFPLKFNIKPYHGIPSNT